MCDVAIPDVCETGWQVSDEGSTKKWRAAESRHIGLWPLCAIDGISVRS